jgi:hypothetical protein
MWQEQIKSSHSPKIIHRTALNNNNNNNNNNNALSSGLKRHNSFDTAPRSSIDGRWRAVVSEYSALQLTDRSDRLPAIHGIAMQFAAHRWDRYLLGIWESTWIQNLLWYCPSQNPKPPGRRAPSWSWASVDGAVSYHSAEPHLERRFVKLVGVDCDQPEDGRSNLRQTSGNLRLFAPIERLRLTTELWWLMYSSYPDYRDHCEQVLDNTHWMAVARTEVADFALVLRLLDFNDRIYERVGLITCTIPHAARLDSHPALPSHHLAFLSDKAKLITLV